MTARNRFYAVPHAAGMTNAMPHMRAAFRGTKAEGGWGVVCSGYVSIDPSSDDAPLPYATLWDEDDVRSHALMTEAVHAHGALAGIELWHGGGSVMNRASRTAAPVAVGHRVDGDARQLHGQPAPAVMDAQDIRALLDMAGGRRRAGRAAPASTSSTSMPAWATCRTSSCCPSGISRTDAYGGSVRNRVRIVRELLEVTHEAVGGQCAVALRISLEELRARPSDGAPSEAHEVVGLLADLPDLWDVKLDSSPTDCAPVALRRPRAATSRIIDVREAAHGQARGRCRPLHLPRHHGRARSAAACSISSVPRAPRSPTRSCRAKIDEGREQDIRECIGCNICISSWHDGVPVRCTQNPTIGEEWRRGWHPERIAARRQRCLGAGRGRRARGPRVRADARPPRLRGHCSRKPPTSSAGACASRRVCRDSPPGGGCSTGGAASSSGSTNVNVYRGNRLIRARTSSSSATRTW